MKDSLKRSREEIKRWKDWLEDRIEDKIMRFQLETGCEVTGVTVTPQQVGEHKVRSVVGVKADFFTKEDFDSYYKSVELQADMENPAEGA